ncbi:hypothetical protein [Asticcacaulis sp. MM231]|uniref:hypothetical protein n=1 Tax=Asticcacaulis sp. MM231 TaxID=3157666 RepID=UPI0032D57B37
MSYTTAFAQDAAPAAQPAATETTAAPDDTQVVVVTGIRNSLQTAATTKRKASTFVEFDQRLGRGILARPVCRRSPAARARRNRHPLLHWW